MAELERYRQLVKQVLTEQLETTKAVKPLDYQLVFDEVRNHYHLVQVGWIGDRRYCGSLIHIDLIGEQIWIQFDGTAHGVANDLVALGVPEAAIVLAYYEPAHRAFTEFATGKRSVESV